MASDAKIETQIKFSFYVVSLVFTLLAASIQTATFGESRFADAAELTAWFFLLVSGLTGLRRIEMMPKIYRLGELSDALQQRGKADDIKKADDILEGKQTSASRWYAAHKTSFVIGLVVVLISRGWHPLLGILRCH